MQELTILATHYDYLKTQHGRVGQYKTWDEWCEAYNKSVKEQFETLKPYLPKHLDHPNILDVGSGLGGIDAHIRAEYYDANVFLLDGVNDSPIPKASYKTFNNMEVAEDFLALNGVHNFHYFDPEKLGNPEPMDIIISINSWCFHYPPEQYIEFVRSCCHKNTVMFIDVRTGKNYLNDLVDVFGTPFINVYEAEKYFRFMWKDMKCNI